MGDRYLTSNLTAKQNWPHAPQDWIPTPQSEPVQDLSTITGCSEELRQLAVRLEERCGAFAALADHVGGSVPTPGLSDTKLTPVANSLIDALRDHVQKIDRLLNVMAADYGRLERAIRG